MAKQVVEATNLEEIRFIGLYAADWINLAISFLLVLLVVTLVARLISSISIKIARRTATPYDEIYLKSIQSYFRWLIIILILYIAATRLQFLSPELKQWLNQIYYAIVGVLVVISLWKLVDFFTLWYQEKTIDKMREIVKRQPRCSASAPCVSCRSWSA